MSERRVGTLRLSAPEEDLVRRGAILAEDALRTATLPGGDGRLWLVRCLDLGTIRPAAGPAALARQIEGRMAALPASAVHAGHPSAPRAPAVYFAEEAEPFVGLARELARGGDASAWFWPLAVQPWRRGLPPAEAWRAVLEGALATAAGAAAAAAVVRELLDLGALAPLAAALRPGDGSRLLRLWSRAGGTRRGRPVAVAIPSSWRRQVAPWVAAWGKSERSLWLASALLTAARPGRLADPRLPARAARLCAELGETSLPFAAREPGAPSQPPEERQTRSAGEDRRSEAAADEPERSSREPERQRSPGSQTRETEAVPAAEPALEPSPGDARASPADQRHTDAAPDGPFPVMVCPQAAPGEREDFEPTPADRLVDPLADGIGAAAHGESVEPAAAPEGWWGGEPRASEWAGLVFLLPVLARLGIEGFLADHPHLIEADLPQRLLHRLAHRLRIPEDDPARAAFPLLDDAGPAVGSFVEPEAWQELAGPRRTPAGDASTPVLEAWLTAARRWCRRAARLGLYDLAHRQGRVVSTRTHLDVLFDLSRVDLRLRRLGLDVDPGWLPWLGRVVRFHYLAERHG